MKIIEKISLIIFANLLLILSVIMCLLIFGWINTEFVFGVITSALNDTVTSNIILGVSIVIILLAIKCIFFDSSISDREKKDGILLENKEGKLLISKETLETLIASVAKGFEGAESVTSKVMLDKENNVTVFVNLLVHPDAIIKDL